MVSLEFLQLNGNRITSFATDGLQGLTVLERIVIQDNPIICDVIGLPVRGQPAANQRDSPVVACFGCQMMFNVRNVLYCLCSVYLRD